MVSVYGSLAYARTLPHIGTPLWLNGANGTLLRRKIPESSLHDLVGPYPWADFADWSRLELDLMELSAREDPPVSVVSVISPTSGASEHDLKLAFPDRLVAFKAHHLVDLTGDFARSFSSGHRRKARRVRPSVSVAVVTDPSAIASEWVSLYAHLVGRHAIEGSANFPVDALEAQLALPGAVACVARIGDEAVGAITFLRDGEMAAYHLGAFSPAGYEHEVAFTLFPTAFEHLASLGVTLVNLGGGSGTSVDESDGLVQFKRGWSTHVMPSLLGGRVLDRSRYTSLSGAIDCEFFPRYRGGFAR